MEGSPAFLGQATSVAPSSEDRTVKQFGGAALSNEDAAYVKVSGQVQRRPAAISQKPKPLDNHRAEESLDSERTERRREGRVAPSRNEMPKSVRMSRRIRRTRAIPQRRSSYTYQTGLTEDGTLSARGISRYLPGKTPKKPCRRRAYSAGGAGSSQSFGRRPRRSAKAAQMAAQAQAEMARDH